MSIFEITIQHQRTPTEWPVVIKIKHQDKLPIQKKKYVNKYDCLQ